MDRRLHPEGSPDCTVTREGGVSASAGDAYPTRVGRYEIRGLLGAGGMGVVLHGYDPHLDRPVAVKLLRQRLGDAQAKLRMLREAQAMAKLSHTNVVQIYDSGTQEGEVFLAMELVEGVTLREWLRSDRRSWQAILDCFVAAGEGLAAAHVRGLVHRDFKPDNVLISQEGRVCVADFGIASNARAEAPVLRSTSSRNMLSTELTSTGATVGTPRYMAPEQSRGERVGPAADQYSFCVAFHEALFGIPPPAHLSCAVSLGDPEPRRRRSPDVGRRSPRWLADAIRRGLSDDPQQRYEDMATLLSLLARRRQTRFGPRWSRVGAATVGVGTLALGLGFGRQADEDPCRRGELMMEDTWREHTRQWRASDADLFRGRASLASALDRYADRWASAYRDSCELHDANTTSAAVLQDSMSCLGHARAAMTQLISLAEADPNLDPEALQMAAARLPSLRACAGARPSAVVVSPPGESEGEVEALRIALAGVRVTHDAGRTSEALGELDRILVSADALDWGPLQAEAERLAGVLAMERRDWPVARERLAKALAYGLASGADSVAAEADARLLFVDAMRGQPLEALEAHPHAWAWVERAGGQPALEALLANNEGVVLGLRGDHSSARKSFARALRTAAEEEAINAVDHSGYAVNLALLTEDPAQRDNLFALAESVVQETFGPLHIHRINHALLRAETTPDPHQALDRFAPICATLQERSGDDPLRCSGCYDRIASLHEQLGDAEAARRATDRGLVCLGDGELSGYARAQRELLAASASRLAGRNRAALTSLEAAQRTLEPRQELPWVALDLARVTVDRARVMVDGLGQRPDLEALRHALALYRDRAAMTVDQASRDRIQLAESLLQRGTSMPSAVSHR